MVIFHSYVSHNQRVNAGGHPLETALDSYPKASLQRQGPAALGDGWSIFSGARRL